MLEKFTRQLAAAEPLDEQQITVAVEQLINADVPALTKAEFLGELARKGETVEEITIFARTLLQKSIIPTIGSETRSREILDVVGTGGDRLGTFNISTTVAIVCAAAGVLVAKHGNRGATSRCGSADVLEVLGVRIGQSPDEAARALHGLGFAFFFAPNYHPAFKNVAAARKLCAERGQRPIFNYLGPLLNPARPSAMLVGVARPELCEPIARVLQSLGVRRAMVVCGKVNDGAKGKMFEGHNSAYLDELSTLGENTIAEFYQENGSNVSTLTTEEFPLQAAMLQDLAGSDQQSNGLIVRSILKGEERGPKRDAILLNASAALMVAGRVKSMSAGWELAAETIDRGQAWNKLVDLSR